MKSFNLSSLAQEADNAETSSGDFIIPENGKVYEGATVKYAKVSDNRANPDLPAWWLIISCEDGEFPVPLRLGKQDFANKRVFSSLRGLGITNFENLDADVAAVIMKDAKVNVKVKWGENKKNPEDPWANHEISAAVVDIPLFEDDDEDY